MLSYFEMFAPNPSPPVGWGWGGGGLTKISIFWQFMKCLTFEIFIHKTPNPRWVGVGLIFCYYFSRQFMTFPGLLICWPPKIPTATPFGGGGGVGVKKLLSIFSTVHEIYRTFEIWTPTPPLLEPPPPRVGWVKTNCIDFLDSSWHFPDFWNFDPQPPPPLEPPGWVG